MNLTAKQKIFADEYLIDLNATRAYRIAYPNIKSDNVAAVNASKLLRNAKVTAYIDKRMKDREKRTEITQDRVLKELAAIGFADIADYAKIEEKTAENDSGMPIKYKSVELAITEEIPVNKRSAISGIKQGANGIEIKLNDKVKALELLGKHLGMFTDNINLNADVGVTIVNDIPKDTG